MKKSLGGFVAAQHVGWSAADVTTLFYSRHYLTVSPIWHVESFISDIYIEESKKEKKNDRKILFYRPLGNHRPVKQETPSIL